VGKYNFHGTITDLSTGAHSTHHGPAALHLATGLVTLPGMQDPTAALFPFASVVDESDAKQFEKDEDTEAFAKGQEKAAAGHVGRQVLKEALSADGLPIAQRVPESKEMSRSGAKAGPPPSSGGIAYGYQDPALQDHDPNDHGAVSILDPQLYLDMVGLNWKAPRNVRAREQQDVRDARDGGAKDAPVQATPVFLR